MQSFGSIISYSLWITFNSICIRKTRYASKETIICGNYIDNESLNQSILVIPKDKKISISRIVIILFPTIITLMFILISFYYFMILVNNYQDIDENIKPVISIILGIVITFMSIVTFYIGTNDMDWNRQLVSSQYGLANGGLYLVMYLNYSFSFLNIFINLGIVFTLSIFPIIYECICGEKQSNKVSIVNKNKKQPGNKLSIRIVEEEIDIENNNNLNYSHKDSLPINRSVDNLVDYGSMQKNIDI